MRVIVDTAIWSLAMRRRRKDLSASEKATVMVFQDLIAAHDVCLLGVVRQEVLTGIRDSASFERLRLHLADFDDEPISPADHEEAARCHNACLAAGVAASIVDMLICAIALRLDAGIFTTDADFVRYQKHLGIKLPTPQRLRSEINALHDDSDAD